MSSFTGNIQLEQLGLTDNCVVLKDFSYYTEDGTYLFNIHKGFITDLGSIPQSINGIVRASANKTWRCYAIHDLLYRTGWVSQKKADLILDECLKLVGVSWYARSKVYYGLRMFGSPTDNEDLINNAHQYGSMIEF